MSTHVTVIEVDTSEVPVKRSQSVLDSDGRKRLLPWGFLFFSMASGCLGLAPELLTLWRVWTTDPLRSVGLLIVVAAVLLVAREWRNSGWELQGVWWGLVPLALTFGLATFPRTLLLSWRHGPASINLMPTSVALYLYATGVVLLFAGPRVWRRAWFPLALLLCAQPVPRILLQWLDFPLQHLAAHTARSFAALIGFSPSDPELLRLMFTPRFGMFIAPGCDGIRGAVSLGYAALIVGYLKRASVSRWILYVLGAVLLGHFFNLVRLCALVLYYRVAVGRPALEDSATMADYVIGGVLFFIAVVLFFTLVLKEGDLDTVQVAPPAPGTLQAKPWKAVFWKLAVFFILALPAAMSGLHLVRLERQASGQSIQSRNDLGSLLPDRMGHYAKVRSWQEQQFGASKVEMASYQDPSGQNVVLGIWLQHNRHSIHDSWRVHGESPQTQMNRQYATSGGKLLSFDTAYYRDANNLRFAGNVECTPTDCRLPVDLGELSMTLMGAAEPTATNSRAVSMFFYVEQPAGGSSEIADREHLSATAQDFLKGVSFTQLSGRFQ